MRFLPALLTLLLLSTGCQTTSGEAPLSQEDVVELVQRDTSPETLGMAVERNGIGFPLDAATLLTLREDGVTDGHVEALLAADARRRNARSTQGGRGRQAAAVGLDLARWLGPAATGSNLSLPPISLLSNVLEFGKPR